MIYSKHFFFLLFKKEHRNVLKTQHSIPKILIKIKKIENNQNIKSVFGNDGTRVDFEKRN